MNRFVTVLAAGVALAATTAATAPADAKVKIDYWYGLGGYLGEQVQATCDRFNAAQNQYEIVCTGQGGYANAVQNTIAAFRAGKHPTIVQAYDAGTADLMMSGEFYPAHKLMADHGIDIDWTNYFPGIANYYASSKGEMFSFPFNSSTPMLYFNKDAYKMIGRTKPVETWEEFAEVNRQLKAAGHACPWGYSLSSWVDLEQFSMAHGVPIASNNNGYDGLDSEMLFNTTLHAQHMKNIKGWLDEGIAVLKTRAGGMTSRDAFANGICAHYFGSIASHAAVHAGAVDGLSWDVTMIPIYEGQTRHNTVVGGASLWVLSGKTEEEYRGAAAYLKFLIEPESEEFWSTVTGYIPVTRTGFDSLVAKGFYENPPYQGRELALKSLTYTDPTPLTRGIRLGGFIQIRKEWTEEMQAALAGDKSVQAALDSAAERSNKVLAKFARTYRGKDLP